MTHLPRLLTIALLLGGCTLQPAPKTPVPDLSAPGQELIRSGQTLQAAEFYQQLADQTPQKKDIYRMLAADLYLQSGHDPEAQQLLQQVNPGALSAIQRNHLYLLTAQTHLNFAEAEQALDALDSISLIQLAETDKATFHKARAFAFSLTGQALKSAQERINLSAYLSDAQNAEDNNTAIYESLSLLSNQSLAEPPPLASDTLQVWMQLTYILKSQRGETQAAQLQQWRHTYPNHPANTQFLATYLQHNQPQSIENPGQIAILLPETGAYAKVAQAIREGIEIAHSQDFQSTKPQLRFYDSSANSASALYERAKTDGAELVIGPLQKNNISQLVAATELNTPVLALNHIPGLKKNNLYQFGLSPLDEAAQVTLQASSEGYNKALLLLPDNNLGHRISEYYTTSWQDNQGSIVELQYYQPKAHDYSKPIKQLLNIDNSEARYRRIRKLIPGINFSPRRRSDANALFLSGSPSGLRLLNPHLHFYRANSIPTYATAQAYGKRPNPGKDIDLNGITFCDIPWVLNDDYHDQLSINNLKQAGYSWPANALKFVALGMDAYNLIGHLNQLDSETYAGATGQLMLTSDYRVKRELACAKFVKGYPKTITYIDTSSSLESINELEEPMHNPFDEQSD